MILKIVTVKDRALQAFGRPIFVHTEGQAIRSFQDEINRQEPNNEMNRHPDDYDLWLLGTWDDNTGNFFPEIRQLAIGKQLQTTKD